MSIIDRRAFFRSQPVPLLKTSTTWLDYVRRIYRYVYDTLRLNFWRLEAVSSWLRSREYYEYIESHPKPTILLLLD
jgi:hypothetical protein